MKERRIGQGRTPFGLYRNMEGVRAGDTAILEHLTSLATIQDEGIQKRLQKELIREYVILERRVDGLLKNTLPGMVADEIK